MVMICCDMLYVYFSSKLPHFCKEWPGLPYTAGVGFYRRSATLHHTAHKLDLSRKKAWHYGDSLFTYQYIYLLVSVLFSNHTDYV